MLGTPLNRCEKLIAVMIEKNQGNTRIKKLRLINIHEVDYGSIVKHFSPHKATHHTKQTIF